MIVWLDQKIFGGGYGLRSPFCDDRYYWLGGKRGELYTFIGGLGAQLQSFQWTHPKPGEERHLSGHTFRVFGSERSWLRVRVAWAATDLPRGAEALDSIRKLETELGHVI